jgi:hypothetical protein
MHKTNACNLNISKGHIHSYSHKLNKLACRYCKYSDKSSARSIVSFLESATDPKLFLLLLELALIEDGVGPGFDQD